MQKGHIVVSFGRFSPPTKGHEKLIFEVLRQADIHESEHIVYVSRTQDVHTDPIEIHTKLRYLEKIFPWIVFSLTDDANPSISKYLIELGQVYESVTFVVGSDRVETFTKMFERANDTFYQFKSWEVVSAGDRTDENNLISGTKMREYVRLGDLHSFLLGLPGSCSAQLGVMLFEDMMAAMGINTDEPEEGTSNAQEEEQA
jgi:hypothetical protein